MAVVAPAWIVGHEGYWRSRWRNVQLAEDSGLEGHAVYYASCRCASSNDAEKRALGIAFLLAYDIVKWRRDEKVEIISDSLIVLDWVMNNRIIRDPILDPLRSLWMKRTVILCKVSGHRGNQGNEIADRWARHARLNFSASSEKQGATPYGLKNN